MLDRTRFLNRVKKEPPRDRGQLFGREAILGELIGRIERAIDGHGGMVLIRGEPGIGKTAVVEALLESVAERDVSFAWATCREEAAAPPGWVLNQLAEDPRARGLAEAVTELISGQRSGAADPETVRSRRFERLERAAAAVAEVAHRRPLLLVIDDLQWADRTTLDLLEAVVPRARTAPLLVLATYRSTEVAGTHPLSSMLDRLDTRVEHVALEGLDEAAIAELMAAALGERPADEAVSQVRRHTGGNALFVAELARFVAMQERPTELLDADTVPLPHGIREVLLRRMARLSPPHVRILEVAAVAGTSFTVEMVASLSGTDHELVLALFEDLVGAGLIDRESRVGGRYRFAHELTRAVAYGSLPPQRRQELHGATATALYEHGSDAAIAYHLLRAGPDRREEAVRHARRAARHAMGLLAYEEAAGFLEQALEAGSGHAEVRGELLVDLGEVRRGLGDREAAVTAFEAAADLAREAEAAGLLGRVGLAMGGDAGGFEIRLMDPRQIGVIRSALDALPEGDRGLRARLLARLAVATTHIESAPQRRTWSDEAVRLARDTEDPTVLIHALAGWCDTVAHPEHAAERLVAATQMLALAEQVDQPVAALLARRLRLMAMLENGDPTADVEIELYAALSERLGHPLYLWYVPLLRGMRALSHGALDRCEQHLVEAEAIGARAGSTNAAILVNAQRTAVMLARHRDEEALERFERTVGDFPEIAPHPAIRSVHARLLAGSGYPARARGEVAGILADGGGGIPRDSEHLSTLGHAAAACLQIGDVEPAVELYQLLRPHAGLWIVEGIAAVLWGPVDLLLGRLAALGGQAQRATGHFEEALAACARLDSLLWRSEVEHAYGRLLLEVGSDPADRSRGTRLLRSAASIREEAGLPPHRPLPDATDAVTAASGPEPADPEHNVFRRDGRLWTARFAGRTVHLPDAKGMHDLAYLLAAPGREIPSTALIEAATGQPVSTATGAPVLDDYARAAYRARLVELERDVEEAEQHSDIERASRARAERDLLVEELKSATGLGGRSRRLGDDVERARKAVTMRLRASIRRIRAEHPELGRHLERAIRTGARCSYDPERETTWRT